MVRRSGFIIAGVLLGLQLAAAAVNAAPGTSPFAGIWLSTDYDGSQQMLNVSAGGSPRVVYQDFYASGCDTFAGPATHWVAAGRGSIEGDALWVEFHKSGCGTFLQGGYGDGYFYDGSSDTLIDLSGIVWSRAR
jgi:hypothetical protein